MAHIEEERTLRLLESALLEFVSGGRAPTSGELEEALARKTEEFGLLTRSSLRLTHPPERFSESSASEFTKMIKAVDEDREVLLRSLVQVEELGQTVLSEWAGRASALKARIQKLLARVESLVLLESEAAGYVSFVEDGFFSLENINSDTTAYIDTTTGEVVLGVDRSDADPASGGTRVNVSDATITANIIESGNLVYTSTYDGSDLRNLLLDDLSRWGLEVRTKQPSTFRTSNVFGRAVVLEIRIGFPTIKEISKIALLISAASAGAQTVATIQYSENNYTWEKIPAVSNILSGIDNFVFRFPKTKMKAVKILLSKASPDEFKDGIPSYEFGLQQIKFFNEQYLATDSQGAEYVLYSENRIPILSGSPVLFGRASLEVCEEVPDGTDIRYELRAYDGSSYTDWVPVSPLSRGEGGAAVVDFSAPASYSSDELTTSYDSSLDIESLNIYRLDGDSDLAYRFLSPDDTVANFYMAYDSEYLSNLVFLRNISYLDGKYPAVDKDLKVGDVECGWGLEGDNIYYCQFEVKNPDGLLIDLGKTQASVDGKRVSGLVRIKSGWHKFSTSRANWYPLNSSLFSSAPTTEAELKAGDILYPYNHKYLIEGYNYPANFSGGDKPYIGADSCCQYLGTRIGAQQMGSYGLDLSVYALDTIGSNTCVLLKIDSSRAGYINERVRLRFDRRFGTYESIQLKATLSTSNAVVTPVLAYYRVRVQ
jgi:hypothetical protein